MVTVRARRRPHWKDQFFREFAKCGILTVAARAAGVDRHTVQYHRNRHPKFAAQFERALLEANEILEAHALKLAVTGQEDPIFMRDSQNNPVKVFDRRRQSEKIMELLLRARMPEKYNPKTQAEISGPGGIPLSAPVTPITCIFTIPPNNRNDPCHAQDSQKALAEAAADVNAEKVDGQNA
jgi:hypothetical protein